MAKLRVHNIEPSTGTDVAFGTTGDTIAVSSDSLKLNVWKDSGANTLFQSDGAGTLSNVNSSFSGAGPKLILSQTADGSATINFTANIDNTYDKYMFVYNDCNPVSDNVDFEFNGSTDGGSAYDVTKTSTWFYASHSEAGTDGTLAYDTSKDLAQSTAYQPLSFNTGNGADESCGGILYLYSPSSTTFVKQFYARTQSYRGNDTSWDCFAAGYMNTTTAVNAVSFKFTSGNFDGTITMYGVS